MESPLAQFVQQSEALPISPKQVFATKEAEEFVNELNKLSNWWKQLEERIAVTTPIEGWIAVKLGPEHPGNHKFGFFKYGSHWRFCFAFASGDSQEFLPVADRKVWVKIKMVDQVMKLLKMLTRRRRSLTKQAEEASKTLEALLSDVSILDSVPEEDVTDAA